MLELIARLGQRASTAVKQKYEGAEVAIELPFQRATRPEFADLQCSSALQLAKPLKKPPREVGQTIADAVKAEPGVARVELAGPGFVNVYLDDRWLAARADARRGDAKLGLRDV